jgi:hypothetical protein
MSRGNLDKDYVFDLLYLVLNNLERVKRGEKKVIRKTNRF